MRALALAAAVATSALAMALVASACGDDTTLSPIPADAAPDVAVDATAEAGEDAAPVPKGDRVLGLGLDITAVDYYPNVLFARDAGVSSTNVDLPWDRVERLFDAGADADAALGLYAPQLHALNLILPDQRMSLALALPALDETGARLPPDLVGKAVDDPAVGPRYDAVLDYVLGELAETDLSALLVGDAVDGPLGNDPAKWSAFATFVGGAATHAHAKRPKVKVGFTISADALTSKKDLVVAALAAADVVALDYVPVDGAGKALPVTTVAADVARAVDAAPAGKPILFRAVGYPSAPDCGGSDEAQAAFVSALFTAWDRGIGRVSTVGFVALDDVTDQEAAARAAALGKSDPAYAAMLGSLGLRTAGGRTKPALGVLLREARARGF